MHLNMLYITVNISHSHCIPENIPETTPLPPMFPICHHDLLEDPPFIIIQLKPPFIVNYPMFPMIFWSKPSFMADGSFYFWRMFPPFFPIFSWFSHRHVYQSTWFLRSRAAAAAAMAPVVLPATATSTRCCVGEWFALVSWWTGTDG